MLREMTHRELLEWLAFAELEPFNPERDDLRFASVVQAMMNAWRDTKKKQSPFTLQDAALRFGDTPEPKAPQQSWQQMKLLGQMHALSFNAANDAELKRRR